MSDVINSQISIWRQKCQDGTITLPEMRDAIAAIRKERVGAQETSTKSKTTKAAKAAKAAPIDSDDLLGQLGL
jgi:hypothetical protein